MQSLLLAETWPVKAEPENSIVSERVTNGKATVYWIDGLLAGIKPETWPWDTVLRLAKVCLPGSARLTSTAGCARTSKVKSTVQRSLPSAPPGGASSTVAAGVNVTIPELSGAETVKLTPAQAVPVPPAAGESMFTTPGSGVGQGLGGAAALAHDGASREETKAFDSAWLGGVLVFLTVNEPATPSSPTVTPAGMVIDVDAPTFAAAGAANTSMAKTETLTSDVWRAILLIDVSPLALTW